MRALQLPQKTRRKDFRVELALLHAIAAGNPLYILLEPGHQSRRLDFAAHGHLSAFGSSCRWVYWRGICGWMPK